MSEARDVDFGLSVSWGIVAQFTMAAIGFIGTILFARILGPTSFGGYYLLFSLVKLADRPTSGIGIALKKRLSEDNSQSRELLGVGVLLYVLTGFVAIPGAIVFREEISSYTGLPHAEYLFISLFLTLGLFEMSQKVLSAEGVVGKTLWIDTIRSLLTFPAQLALVLASWGATGMAYGLVIATIPTIFLTLWSIGQLPSLPSRDRFKSVLRFGQYSIPNSFLNKTYRQYDTLLLGWLLAPGAAGQYETAFKLTVPAVFIAGSISSGLMAQVSNLNSIGESYINHVVNSISFASLIAVPVFFGALAIPDVLVLTVYGSEYRGAITLLAGLALFQLIYSQSQVLSTTINGINRPDWTMKTNIFIVVVNIILGYFLALQMGAVGVVYATVFSEFLRYISHAWFLTKTQKITLVPKTLQYQFLSGIVMYLVVELVQPEISVDSWIPLLLILVLGGSTYFSVLSIISPKFRQTAIPMLKKMSP